MTTKRALDGVHLSILIDRERISNWADKGAKPLETLTIDVNGNPVPALSSFFAESRAMVPFSAPPRPNKQGQFVLGAKDSWFHKMEAYKDNMLWLLGLSHHKFWSQIVYGAETWDSVISFLQEAYPFYAADNLPDDEDILAVYYQIYYLVYNVFKRAMTKKESDVNFIGKKYGSLLYNYTIISVPMLIDLCALYGERYQREIGEMLDLVFSAQPLYVKDLENSVQTVKMAFSSVEEKFIGRSVTPGEITKLTEGTRTAQRLSLNVLQDAVYYLLDIAVSLTLFLESYKPAASIFHKHKFEVNIARLYENVFPSAVHQVQDLCDNDEAMSLYFTLMFKLNNARFYFLKLFRLCIQESLKLMTTNSSENNAECQVYLDHMTECLTCSVFMKDYHSKFPIDHDLDAIAQNCPEFDNIKYNFLLESLMACFDEPEKPSSSHPPKHLKPKINTVSHPSGEPSQSEQASGPSKDDDKDLITEKAITEVKDCLPHLGDGFILKCLEHFNMNSSECINAILENSLPKEILTLDPELPIIPPEEDPNTLPKVFNEEQFEDLCMDFDKRFSVHKGKKQGKEKDLKQLLDDKSFMKDCGSRFSQLGIIESYDDVYDDEYDDTYDDSEPPVPEVEEPDRKFVVPRVLQQGRRRDESCSEGDEEEEEETDEQKKQKSLNFVENPEDVRARYAQKRMANMRQPSGPRRDVVGNPKGQGQDNSVLRNRQQKTAHKSANRKKAAQFKKSKGMF